MIPFATEEHAIAWLFSALRDDHPPASVVVAGARMTGWTYEAESDHVSTGRCALVDFALVDYDDPQIADVLADAFAGDQPTAPPSVMIDAQRVEWLIGDAL